MKWPVVLAFLALGLLAAGVTLGVMPLGADCGSAFASSEGDGCDVLASQARALPVALLIVGFALLTAAAVGVADQPKAEEAPPA